MGRVNIHFLDVWGGIFVREYLEVIFSLKTYYYYYCWNMDSYIQQKVNFKNKNLLMQYFILILCF